MGRLLLLLMAAAALVAGSLVTLSSLHAAYRALNGPVTERDLLVFTGRLSRVTPCSTGRNSRFVYTVSHADRSVESSAACPSTQQPELARRVGSEASLRYVVYRDTYFLSQVKVYEFVVAGQPLWTFNEIASREASERWVMNLLNVLGAFVGVGLAWHGWRDLKKCSGSDV